MAKESKEKKKRPTALKRAIQGEKKRLINKSFKSKVKTAIRQLNETVEGKDPAKETLSEAYSAIDKAVKRGLYKQNKGDRLKSRLTKKAAALV